MDIEDWEKRISKSVKQMEEFCKRYLEEHCTDFEKKKNEK